MARVWKKRCPENAPLADWGKAAKPCPICLWWKWRRNPTNLQTNNSKPDPLKQAAQPIDGSVTRHQGAEGQTNVNNTRLRRWLTLLALKTTAHFFPAAGRLIPISKNLVVKRGRSVSLTESSTMRFVATNTSIPVPRVCCAFVHRHVAYIVMKRVQGVTLAEALAKASPAEKDSLLEQLRFYITELRSITSPHGTRVQSCIGGPLRDSRISAAEPSFGPFATINDFHIWLRRKLRLEDIKGGERHEDWPGLKNMIARQDKAWLQPCIFTHADLNPFNILVLGMRIVSIIDWEFSGWYPYYWEYTSTWLGSELDRHWRMLIPEWLETHEEDLDMEIVRQRYWADG
ncbi:hypothetical protein FH972_024133 [Carpinus fangiana]|uniref:Aminoglycoside phosphotransferase domain-containing protein n=1 Tax=Carpinus fangiana TaxID=176857 RepID=A0A5N6KXK2_9ROSI|nr:hypothetical protein FH972_024133 [Carpinus fangiana]